MKLMTLSVENSRGRHFARVAVVAGLVAALSLAADTKLYLDIKGVTGDVTDRGYENQIAVLSYDLALVPEGGGSMSLVKPVDSSSPILMLLAVTGDAVRRAILRVVELTDGKKDPKLTIDMRDVIITSVQVSGNSTGGPLESVSMNFAKVDQKYQNQDKK